MNKKEVQILLGKAEYLALNKGDFNKALDILESFPKKFKDNLDVLRQKTRILEHKATNLGVIAENVLTLKEKYRDKAEKYFLKVLKIDPKHTAAYICLGAIFNKRGKSGKSLKYYDKAIMLLKEGHSKIGFDVEIQEALYSKAELLSNLGKKKEAEECRKEWLKSDNNSELIEVLLR